MPINRYVNISLYRDPGEPAHYGTYDLPEKLKEIGGIDWFNGEAPRQHVFRIGERLDHLAKRYFGDDRLWWVIALVNNIPYPLGIAPNTVLLIPQDYTIVLQKLNLR